MSQHTELHLKHLEFIQEVINRQAQHSFTVKGWSITLSAGIFTFLLTQDPTKQIHPSAYFITLLPTFVFWLLDAYYLRQERLFRCLYNDIRQEVSGVVSDNSIPKIFDMNTSRYRSSERYWGDAFLSLTVFLIPAVIILTSIILFWIDAST